LQYMHHDAYTAAIVWRLCTQLPSPKFRLCNTSHTNSAD
jgi:hypothetical protein